MFVLRHYATAVLQIKIAPLRLLARKRRLLGCLSTHSILRGSPVLAGPGRESLSRCIEKERGLTLTADGSKAAGLSPSRVYSREQLGARLVAAAGMRDERESGRTGRRDGGEEDSRMGMESGERSEEGVRDYFDLSLAEAFISSLCLYR